MNKIRVSLIIILFGFFADAQSLKNGIDLFNNGKFKESSSFFLLIDDDNSERNYYLGRIAFENEKLDEAVDYFEAAIKQLEKPKYFTWLGNSLGVMAQNANVFRQGILAPQIKSAYEKAVSLDPNEMDAQWGLVEYYTLAPGFMGGSWEKAEETALAIGKIDVLRGHDALAIVYSRQEKYALAEKEYIKAAEIDKTRLLSLGMYYQGRGEFEKAFEALEKAYSNDPANYGALYQIGKTSALSGTRFDRGIQCLSNYLKVERQDGNPSDAGALMRLGMIYEKQGMKKKAIESYQESLRQDPEMDLARQGLERVQ